MDKLSIYIENSYNMKNIYKMEKIEQFCRLVRQRSTDNRKAVELLYKNQLYTNIIAILRQELDSMVRVLYVLLQQTESNKISLIESCLRGDKWNITDAKMVSEANKLNGWEYLVYKFGCSFVHLSNLCDINAINFSEILSEQERNDIANYINAYHYWDKTEKFPNPFTVDDISSQLLNIFEKITDNLEYYLEKLETNKKLNEM